MLVLAAIERVDQIGEFLVDDLAADLAGAGQLSVVGVEFLVQDQEAVDLATRQHRVGRDRAVDLFHMALDHFKTRGCWLSSW